jgi:Polyketide cyclase / dehydrase and lipid transport
MGVHRGEESIEIDAPMQQCFDAVVDYESVSEWQTAAKEVVVRDRYPDGLAKTVEWHVDLKLRVVRYTLEYSYDSPVLATWDFVDGDVAKHIDGAYEFAARNGATLATYRLGIDPGLPLPGAVVKRVGRELMKRSLADLKAEVERRARAA